MFAEQEAELLLAAVDPPQQGPGTGPDGDRLTALVARRVAGEPLETVLGWAAFCDLRVQVSAGVFVPRRRTELLAHAAVDCARAAGPHPVLLDLCCGSGAIAMVAARDLPGAEVHASDVEPVAVQVARRNLAGRAQVHQGDLFAPLPPGLRGRVDVLVANVPYVPSEAIAGMPPEAREHEPRQALDGGPDGLAVLRRVAAQAPSWLAPGGVLLCEVSPAQLPAARAALARRFVPQLLSDPEREATALLSRLAEQPGPTRPAGPRPASPRAARRPPPG